MPVPLTISADAALNITPVVCSEPLVHTESTPAFPRCEVLTLPSRRSQLSEDTFLSSSLLLSPMPTPFPTGEDLPLRL